MTAPNNHDKAYKTFRDAFEQGVAHIENINADLELGDESDMLVRAAADATAREMAATAFGGRLMRDSELVSVLAELEHGLQHHSGELDPQSAGYEWANGVPQALRALRFWGGLGEIFHYFRDQGLSLTTVMEGHSRKSLVEAGDEFVARLDELLGHISVQLAYDKAVIRKMKAARHALQDLNGKLDGKKEELDGEKASLKGGLDGKKAPLDPQSTATNPFQAGQTIVLRQFVKAVCQLCFELFGCIRSKHVDLLLERKSSTAEGLGLSPWLSVQVGELRQRDNRRRDLDRYIAAALEDALKQSSSDEWPTTDALKKFYSTTAERDVSAHGGASLENVFRGWHHA